MLCKSDKPSIIIIIIKRQWGRAMCYGWDKVASARTQIPAPAPAAAAATPRPQSEDEGREGALPSSNGCRQRRPPRQSVHATADAQLAARYGPAILAYDPPALL